jgi:hypothetical protein
MPGSGGRSVGCDTYCVECRGDSSGFWTDIYGDCPYVNESQLESASAAGLPFTLDDALNWLSFKRSWLASPLCPRPSLAAERVRIVDCDPRLLRLDGCDCLRCAVDGGDEDRGGVDDEEWMLAQSEGVSGKNPLVGHELPLAGSGWTLSSRLLDGVGEGEGALEMIDNGGNMLKIESSAWGGPYESKGSGMA